MFHRVGDYNISLNSITFYIEHENEVIEIHFISGEKIILSPPDASEFKNAIATAQLSNAFRDSGFSR